MHAVMKTVNSGREVSAVIRTPPAVTTVSIWRLTLSVEQQTTPRVRKKPPVPEPRPSARNLIICRTKPTVLRKENVGTENVSRTVKPRVNSPVCVITTLRTRVRDAVGRI